MKHSAVLLLVPPADQRDGRTLDLESRGDELSPAAGEVVRASAPVADIVTSLLLTLFPRAALYRVGTDVQRLLLDPAPRPERLPQLRTLLFDLAERPEWRRRHLVTREVEDPTGRRLEALLPLAPADYSSGARLVGPFATEALAYEWGADHAVSTLSYDVFALAGGRSEADDDASEPQDSVWLCDLFDLPERQ